MSRKLLGYFQEGAAADWKAPDQARLRELVPERERRAYKVAPIIETLADEGSVTFLRERFALEVPPQPDAARAVEVGAFGAEVGQ